MLRWLTVERPLSVCVALECRERGTLNFALEQLLRVWLSQARATKVATEDLCDP